MELDRLGRPHICHATGCDARVPRRMFMCRKHWFMLPRPHRDAIWRHYQEGQEQGLVDPTPDYLAAATAAIAWLAAREKSLAAP